MKVVFVEIAEIHRSLRKVEVADDATREQICDEAAEAAEISLEYSDTDETDTWTIRDEAGNYMSEEGKWT